MTLTPADRAFARTIAANIDVDYLNECIAAEPFAEPTDELTEQQAEAEMAEAIWSDKK